MNHKVKVKVPVQKKGLFGITRTVMKTQTIEVDGKTYRKMKKEQRRKEDEEFLRDIIMYDLFFDD